MMPKRSKNRRSGKTGRRSGKTGTSSVDSELMKMNKGTPLSDIERTDLSSRPRNWQFVEKPPLRFMTQIVWVKQQRSLAITTGAAAIAETNVAFASSDFPQTSPGAGWALQYDQYGIYSVTASVSNGEPPGTVSAVLPNITTAIDYDNIGNVGSVAALQQFSNATTITLGPGQSLVRYIRPCVNYALSAGAIGICRTWVDSASSPAHNGFRSVVAATPAAALTLNVTFTYVFVFRNSI
jgi:hypothetical protein